MFIEVFMGIMDTELRVPEKKNHKMVTICFSAVINHELALPPRSSFQGFAKSSTKLCLRTKF